MLFGYCDETHTHLISGADGPLGGEGGGNVGGDGAGGGEKVVRGRKWWKTF